MLDEISTLLSERAALMERQYELSAELRSVKMKRGWREKKLRALAGHVGCASIHELEAYMDRHTVELMPDVPGHPCPECSGAGGDGLCACLGTGWIEAE